jgi:hypothetical protein
VASSLTTQQQTVLNALEGPSGLQISISCHQKSSTQSTPQRQVILCFVRSPNSLLVMSSVPNQSNNITKSELPTWENCYHELRTHQSTHVPESHSAGGGGSTSPGSLTSHRTDSYQVRQTQLPFAMERWLVDENGDRLTASLAMSAEFPNYRAPLCEEGQGIPTTSTRGPRASNHTHATFGTLHARHDEAERSYLCELGTWCDDAKLRYVPCRRFHCPRLNDNSPDRWAARVR